MRLKINIDETAIMYDVEHGKFLWRVEIYDEETQSRIVLWTKTKPKVKWGSHR